ncbi:hypothetical protein EDB85DRAFT_1985284, partial [Lactarius pseudohatsudake]
PIRAQQGREKRQRCSPVGSVADSDVSGDGRVVMTSFKFPQESPAHKSVTFQAKSPVSDGNCDGNGDIEGNDARRAIPLDSEHPISTNTVRVGLFKALTNGNGHSNGHRRRG